MPQPKKSSRRGRVRDATTDPAPQTAVAPAAVAPAVVAPAVVAPPEAVSTPVASTQSNLLQLGSSLSIREVSELASTLKTMLSKGPTDIDLSKLENIDTAGIQLLLVAAATAQRCGFKLKLIGAQGLRAGAARSLGLHEYLGELAEMVS